jgi:putative FmdB family regulatory protein
MPTYDYKCKSCYSVLEFQRGMGEDREPVCCNSIMERVWTPTPAIFNSNGFYKTDNRK